MEPIVVQKYGGSSVADPQRLMQVADRIVATRAQGKRVVVVVSAMGDATNQLMGLAEQVARTPPRRELDMLLSAGERISMSLLCMAIQERGYEAISFTGSQSGILTNDQHFEARIIEVRPVRIQDELARDKIVIVAGFQGMSYKREITTLGRGGSDTTAVALAGALGAEACEIYSDVDGVYDADPRVVLDAERLDALSYAQMEEMARMGARVLHVEAIRFARAHGIALVAKATAGGEGATMIRRDRDLSAAARPAITCLQPLCWLSLPIKAQEQGSWLQRLAEVGLMPALSFWSGGLVELGIWRRTYPGLDATLSALTLPCVPEERAVVSVVGSASLEDPVKLQEAHDLLSASLSRQPQKFWVDPLRWSFCVDLEDAAKIQQVLHQVMCAPHASDVSERPA